MADTMGSFHSSQGLIPLDRNWCLTSSYTRTHIQCLCVHSPRQIRNSCPALCKTSPSLLKSFYFTIPTKSDSSPTRESVQLFVQAVLSGPLNLHKQPPQSSRDFCCPCPLHTPQICPVWPLPTFPPRDTWDCLYQIQNCTDRAVKGSACFLPTPEGVYLNIIFLKTCLSF